MYRSEVIGPNTAVHNYNELTTLITMFLSTKCSSFGKSGTIMLRESYLHAQDSAVMSGHIAVVTPPSSFLYMTVTGPNS